jgi:hypothetical protein
MDLSAMNFLGAVAYLFHSIFSLFFFRSDPVTQARHKVGGVRSHGPFTFAFLQLYHIDTSSFMRMLDITSDLRFGPDQRDLIAEA